MAGCRPSDHVRIELVAIQGPGDREADLEDTEGGTFVNIALWGAKRVALDMNVMLFGERRYMAGTPTVVPQD